MTRRSVPSPRRRGPPGRSAVATNPSMAPPFMSARAESALCCAPPFTWSGSWYGKSQPSVLGSGTHDVKRPCRAGMARKVAVVERALALHAAALAGGPFSTLAAVGGLELAALTGFVVGGVAAGVPVVVDGVSADAALLAAERMVPGAAAGCVAGHRSVGPGAAAVLDELGLEPVLDLGLRLGEGTGACLALPILEAAARILGEMATFDSAGVTDKGG